MVVSEKDEERIREMERGEQAEREEGRIDTEEDKEETEELGGIEGGGSGDLGEGAIGREWNGEARRSLERI
jgi:hypothetical protein